MNDADLEKLTTKPNKLKPKFNRNHTDYEIVLDSSTKELRIDPLTRDCNASWSIVGVGTQRVIPVDLGSTSTLSIEVTAEDGTIKKYLIKIISLSPSSALLSTISLKNYMLSPKFSSSTYDYECNVPCYCSIFQLSSTAPDKNASIKISKFDEEKKSVPLNVGLTQITISVTSPDHSKTADYRVTVHRKKLNFPLSIKSFSCTICFGLLYNPVTVHSDTTNLVCCDHCLATVTRTNKHHPLTGALLSDEFKVLEIEKNETLTNEMVLCPFQCKESIKYGLFGEHIKNGCQKKMTYIDQTEAVIAGDMGDNKMLLTSSSCANCSCSIRKFDLPYHNKEICDKSFGFTKHDVKSHIWEKKFEQQIIAEYVTTPLSDGIKHEENYKDSLYKGNVQKALEELEKACQVYSYGISLKPKEHALHFRLGLVMQEIYYVKDIYCSAKHNENSKLCDDINDEFEFQTESSMIDDIKALTKQKAYNPLSTVDQLKALDEEYHFLLEQGQSEKADYIQKLYAYKQKQQHHEKLNNTSENNQAEGVLNENVNKAAQKYLDAATIDSHQPIYQLHLGICYLIENRYKDALQRFKYAVSLKPNFIEAKFYLALAAVRTDVVKHNVELYSQFFLDGLNLYIYEKLYEKNDIKLICEDFTSTFNILFVNGIQAYINLLCTSKCVSHLFSIFDLSSFLSSLCFQSMHSIHFRNDTFRKYQLSAFDIQLGIVQRFSTDITLKKQDLNEIWNRLLSLVMHFSKPNNDKWILSLQRKICEHTVLLTPRSSQALYHLAEVLHSTYTLTPSEINIFDVETLYRCSIELEGKDQNNGEIMQTLIDTNIWKSLNVKVPVASKTGSKTEKEKVSCFTNNSSPVHKSTPVKVCKSKGKVGVVSTSKAAPKTTARPTATKRVVKPRTVPPPPTKPSSVNKTVEPKNIDKKTTAVGEKQAPAEKLVVKLNPTIVENRLGLARVLSQYQQRIDEAIALYEEVLLLAPHLHDSYIELGNLYMRNNPLAAVDIFCKYPFSGDLSYDDAYLYGEIVRLLVREEKFHDARLLPNMILLGKVLGFSSLEKYVSILENKNCNSFLRELYAGINNKSVEDPEVIAFFKFKLWL